jgi:hypothetical protein
LIHLPPGREKSYKALPGIVNAFLYMDERKSLMELMAFLQANIEKTRDKATGGYSFGARVAYHHNSETKTFNTTVTVETGAWNGGKVSMTENGECPSSSTHHLDFEPKFQSMLFDRPSNLMVIKGNSQKMGGDYQVTIVAL